MPLPLGPLALDAARAELLKMRARLNAGEYVYYLIAVRLLRIVARTIVIVYRFHLNY